MSNIRFTWDHRKAITNLQKHGVSFEEAKTVFYDDNARLISDPDHSEAEERFVLLGISAQLRLLMICHCYRIKDSVIRIISARKATSREQKYYQEAL
jgi:uncharacterized protein